MFEATTGVPAANASVSTIPKLSPPSEGAHSTSAASSSSRLTSSDDLAEHPHAGRVEQDRRELLGRGADHCQLGRDVLAQRLERAQQQRQALALDGLADEHDPQPVARRPQRGDRGPLGVDVTPLGITR